MRLKLPKATANGHRHVAQVLWRRAKTMPTAERVKVLRHVELHVRLAMALDADPDRLKARIEQ
jgi:catechol-2,3-dioxygenase